MLSHKDLRFILLLLIPLTGMVSIGRAQTKLQDSIKLQNLNEVNILIQDRRNARSLSPVQMMRGGELQRSNNLTIADALRYFSGVQLKDYGGVGGLKTVNVRSLGANHTAVFFDGIAISNAQNGQVDLGRYSIDNLEEIALYNGQRSELLQPAAAYASAASIYLKTKRPAFADGKRLGINAAIKGGSFGLINPTANLDFKLNEALSLRLSTEYLRSNGQYKFRYTNGVYDTTAVRSNGDIDALRLQAALYSNDAENARTSWNVQAYLYSSERGLPGAIVSNRFDYYQRQSDENKFLQAELQHQFSSRYSLRLYGRYGEDFTRYTDPEYITTTGILKNEYLQKVAYLSLAQRFKKNENLSFGLSTDLQYNTLDANLYRFAYPQRLTVLNALAAEAKLGKLLLSGNLLSSLIYEDVRHYETARNRNKLNPSLLFRYSLIKNETLLLRGFYKSIFRMPTFNDLYYTFVGNSQLNPEEAIQYDLGLIWHQNIQGNTLKYIDIQTDAYYNTIDNKIIAVPGANLFRWTMINLGKTSIKGLDAAVKIYGTVNNALNFSSTLNYTYQSAKDVTRNSDTYSQQIPYTPKHSGSFVASIFNERWNASYSFVYTGERYSQAANIPVNYLQPWYTSDISAQYLFKKYKRQQLALRAEVNNILNQPYDVVLNFPMPGRNYRFTLSYKI